MFLLLDNCELSLSLNNQEDKKPIGSNHQQNTPSALFEGISDTRPIILAITSVLQMLQIPAWAKPPVQMPKVFEKLKKEKRPHVMCKRTTRELKLDMRVEEGATWIQFRIGANSQAQRTRK